MAQLSNELAIELKDHMPMQDQHQIKKANNKNDSKEEYMLSNCCE